MTTTSVCGAGMQPPAKRTDDVDCSHSQSTPRVFRVGAVSPTHYDRDASLLVQIAGRKRMLLFPPDQLECLLCYPEQHLLRRRARVNLAAVEEDGGLRSRLCAIEVMLEPGDAVFFPPEWAHYTESLSPSMSVTTRFALRRGSE